MGASSPETSLGNMNHNVRIEFCTSWGMQRNFLEVKEFLEYQFPMVRVLLLDISWSKLQYSYTHASLVTWSYNRRYLSAASLCTLCTSNFTRYSTYLYCVRTFWRFIMELHSPLTTKAAALVHGRQEKFNADFLVLVFHSSVNYQQPRNNWSFRNHFRWKSGFLQVGIWSFSNCRWTHWYYEECSSERP